MTKNSIEKASPSESSEFFDTTQIYMVNFLVSRRNEIAKIDFITPYAVQKATFFFDNNDKLKKDVQEFLENGDVKIQDYINACMQVKHRIEFEMESRGLYKYGRVPSKTKIR